MKEIQMNKQMENWIYRSFSSFGGICSSEKSAKFSILVNG